MIEVSTQYPIRHFLSLKDVPAEDLRSIIDTSLEVKKKFKAGEPHQPLTGKVMAMIFEKHSTRTRISFETGFVDLGGYVMVLPGDQIQIGRGETIDDTAKVLSRYVDMIVYRTHEHSRIEQLASSGHIPVINGLTNHCHPCQVMADILTFEEHRGKITGKSIAWIGDGNNMAHSWIAAAVKFGFSLTLACPVGLLPDLELVEWAQSEGADVEVTQDPKAAVDGAHLVTTDTWVSMGDKDADARKALLADYQVNEALMAGADSQALFMHCLPAHREEEVTTGVIDGPQSVVWDEAENRLHVQKGIILWCFKVI